MANETTNVYGRNAEGKPERLAQFTSDEDAAEFALFKRRRGQEVLVTSGKPSDDELAQAFPEPATYVPVNSAMGDRLSRARAQRFQEELDKSALAAADSSETSDGIKEAQKLQEEQSQRNEAVSKAMEEQGGNPLDPSTQVAIGQASTRPGPSSVVSRQAAAAASRQAVNPGDTPSGTTEPRKPTRE
jgi:hypothetical protein